MLYADDRVLCGESVEDLNAVIGRFVEICNRRGLKVKAAKSKGTVLRRRNGALSQCGLKDLSTWNFMLQQSGTDATESL